MSKIVSVETLKKQGNDFITRVVLANLVFVFRIQSRDQPALTCTPRLRISRMRRRKSPCCIEVLIVEILDFKARRSFTVSVVCSITAVMHEHANLMASVKMWRCTALIFCRFFAALRDTPTFRSCLVHLNQSFSEAQTLHHSSSSSNRRLL
jgi:hypothetical protein